MTKVVAAFGNFANAPKNWHKLIPVRSMLYVMQVIFDKRAINRVLFLRILTDYEYAT